MDWKSQFFGYRFRGAAMVAGNNYGFNPGLFYLVDGVAHRGANRVVKRKSAQKLESLKFLFGCKVGFRIRVFDCQTEHSVSGVSQPVYFFGDGAPLFFKSFSGKIKQNFRRAQKADKEF